MDHLKEDLYKNVRTNYPAFAQSPGYDYEWVDTKYEQGKNISNSNKAVTVMIVTEIMKQYSFFSFFVSVWFLEQPFSGAGVIFTSL